MTIGVLAEAAGVGVETVRYYQRRGLLETPLRPDGGIRLYTAAMLARIGFIRHAQSLGFTLEEIKSMLALSERDCGAGRDLVRRKLHELDSRIVQLNRVRTQLRRFVVLCDASRAGDPCPFLHRLSGGGSAIPP